MWDSAIPRCINTLNFGFLPQIIYKIGFSHDYSRNEFRVQGHSDPKYDNKNMKNYPACIKDKSTQCALIRAYVFIRSYVELTTFSWCNKLFFKNLCSFYYVFFIWNDKHDKYVKPSMRKKLIPYSHIYPKYWGTLFINVQKESLKKIIICRNFELLQTETVKTQMTWCIVQHFIWTCAVC